MLVSLTRSEKVILNLSAIDYGGAGKFAVDFNRLLVQNGFSSYLIVKDSKVGGGAILPYQDNAFDNSIGKLKRRAYKKKLTDNLFDYDYYFYNKFETISVVSARKILTLIPEKPDVIFIHWVTDFINANVIYELKRLTGAKIYWLLIDNAPLTGGCHYPWTCDGYTRACTSCPAILLETHKYIAAHNLSYKKKYLPADLGLITFSNSDFVRAKKSALFRDRQVLKLMGFVDDDKFKPGDKVAARHYFDVPTYKPVLFFGAASLKEKRKGIQLLLDALATNPVDNFTLLVAGKFPLEDLKGNVKNLGYLNEDDLVIAYQAADMFICPSIEDSGPIMINQSLMCGTPVVAFDTGVAQDLVITGETGYKARLGDANDLAKGVKYLLSLNNNESVSMSKRCRELAIRLYSKNVLSNQIHMLIES